MTSSRSSSLLFSLNAGAQEFTPSAVRASAVPLAQPSPPRSVGVQYLPTATNVTAPSSSTPPRRLLSAVNAPDDDGEHAADFDTFESSLGALLLDRNDDDDDDDGGGDDGDDGDGRGGARGVDDDLEHGSVSVAGASHKASSAPSSSSSSSSSSSRAPVCRFFLIGDCRIRNCAFLHTRDVVCKFWSRTGHCARGADCMYKHETGSPSPPGAAAFLSTTPNGADVVGSPLVSSIWTSSATSPLSSPSPLPSAAPLARAAEAPLEPYPRAKTTWSLASKLRLKELQAEFAHVPAAVVETSFMDAGCRFDVAKARLLVAAPAPAQPAAAAAPAPAALAASNELLELRREQAAAERALKEIQMPAVPWAATGDTLNAQYKAKREAAIAAAVQRNRMFEMAAQAFRRGDKKAARDFSAQGRRFQAEMEELHAQASVDIFQARNEHGRSDLLDLHGLHPDEAVEIVKKHVQSIRREAKNRKERMFTIVTGTGHHAWNNTTRSKLREAVVECLDRLGCLYRDTSTDQRGGMLSVVVPHAATAKR
jgi:hypothetical protein